MTDVVAASDEGEHLAEVEGWRSAQRARDLADDLDGVAAARAEFAALQVAYTVGDHRRLVLDRLDDLVDELLTSAWQSPADWEEPRPIGAGRLVLGLEVDAYRANKSTTKRTSAQQLSAAVSRHAAGARVMHVDDLRLRKLYEKVLIARSSSPGMADGAITDLTESLAARGYRVPRIKSGGDDDGGGGPEAKGRDVEALEQGETTAEPLSHMDFIVSLHSLSLAVLHRRRGTPGDMALAAAIIDKTVSWRRRRYGADHPYTLVARAHQVLIRLIPLEAVFDSRPLRYSEKQRAQTALDNAKKVSVQRSAVLGERHMATVMALGYIARARRLLGESDEAARAAERALAAAAEAKSRRYHQAPAVARVVLADQLTIRAVEATANAQRLRQAATNLARLGKIAKAQAATQNAAHEERRAAEERQRAFDLLADAEDVLDAQRSSDAWLARLRVIRALLEGRGLPPWHGGPPVA